MIDWAYSSYDLSRPSGSESRNDIPPSRPDEAVADRRARLRCASVSSAGAAVAISRFVIIFKGSSNCNLKRRSKMYFVSWKAPPSRVVRRNVKLRHASSVAPSGGSR